MPDLSPSSSPVPVSELPVKSWLRFVLLANAIGGGFVGVAAVGSGASSVDAGLGGLLVLALVVALFAFGAFTGLALSVPGPSGLRWVRRYLYLQIPVLSSPLLGYQLSSGFGLNFSLGVIGSGLDSQITFTSGTVFGSAGWISIAQGAPFRFGVNVVPIALLLLIGWVLRRHE